MSALVVAVAIFAAVVVAAAVLAVRNALGKDD